MWREKFVKVALMAVAAAAAATAMAMWAKAIGARGETNGLAEIDMQTRNNVSKLIRYAIYLF